MKKLGNDKESSAIVNGTINDAGWSESSYKGIDESERKIWNRNCHTENLALVDMESTARDYAAQGYDIIIFRRQTSIKQQSVSHRLPEYPICHCNGEGAQEPNLANFRPNTPNADL